MLESAKKESKSFKRLSKYGPRGVYFGLDYVVGRNILTLLWLIGQLFGMHLLTSLGILVSRVLVSTLSCKLLVRES